AFFIDHVPGNFHRHVRLVSVLRPWSGERLQDSNLDVLGQCRSEWEAGETCCEHEPRASTQKSLQLPVMDILPPQRRFTELCRRLSEQTTLRDCCNIESTELSQPVVYDIGLCKYKKARIVLRGRYGASR